jgi:hypothetical protein
VNAKVSHTAFHQQRAHRIRHRADTDLQTSAVVDIGCNQSRD